MTLFLGYGSLLSARGLGPQLEGLEDASLAWLRTRRRFGKPPQKGGRLAMEVDAPRALLGGRVYRGGPPEPGPGCGALLLEVAPGAEGALVRREGYPPRCYEALRRSAGSRGVAEYLARLAEEVADEPIAYRAALWALSGPPASGLTHYLPHPVRLDDGRCALVFVAPDAGQTGGPPSCKEAHPGLRSVGLGELYAHGREVIPDWQDALQDDYLELCLLGLAHGVPLADLFAEALPLEHPARLCLARLRAEPDLLRVERAALRGALRRLGGGLEAYQARFAPDLTQAWAWSGLDGLVAPSS